MNTAHIIAVLTQQVFCRIAITIARLRSPPAESTRPIQLRRFNLSGSGIMSDGASPRASILNYNYLMI